MENDQEFEEAIDNFLDVVKELMRETRKLVYKVFPVVVEVVWIQQKNIGFGTRSKKKTEHFCWIMPATKHVTLGFNYGAELPDPEDLLEGAGKLFRRYKVKSIADLSNVNLIQLIACRQTIKMSFEVRKSSSFPKNKYI